LAGAETTPNAPSRQEIATFDLPIAASVISASGFLERAQIEPIRLRHAAFLLSKREHPTSVSYFFALPACSFSISGFMSRCSSRRLLHIALLHALFSSSRRAWLVTFIGLSGASAAQAPVPVARSRPARWLRGVSSAAAEPVVALVLPVAARIFVVTNIDMMCFGS